MSRPVHTPWGTPQTVEPLADGIIFYSTAEHGGFFVDSERNAMVPHTLRLDDGWYEEDINWAIVATVFPDYFSEDQRTAAAKTLKNWFPDQYETLNGVTLQEGESHVKDQRLFNARHFSDWQVIAAVRSDQHPGFVECVASISGDRNARDQKRFLVPVDEYKLRRFNFIIDRERHDEYTGPSNFATWAH